MSSTPARVRVTSRIGRRGALHVLTARLVLCGWCVENAEKITARTRVNVETWWHCGEPNDYTNLPTLTVTCVCVSLACVFTCDLLWPSQRVSSSLLTHVCVCVSTPASLRNPGISFFPIATRSVLTSVLSPTHTSAHAFTVGIATCRPKKKVPIGKVSSAATKTALLRASETAQGTEARLAYQRNRATAPRGSETPQETEARLAYQRNTAAASRASETTGDRRQARVPEEQSCCFQGTWKSTGDRNQTRVPEEQSLLPHEKV